MKKEALIFNIGVGHEIIFCAIPHVNKFTTIFTKWVNLIANVSVITQKYINISPVNANPISICPTN